MYNKYLITYVQNNDQIFKYRSVTSSERPQHRQTALWLDLNKLQCSHFLKKIVLLKCGTQQAWNTGMRVVFTLRFE